MPNKVNHTILLYPEDDQHIHAGTEKCSKCMKAILAGFKKCSQEN